GGLHLLRGAERRDWGRDRDAARSRPPVRDAEGPWRAAAGAGVRDFEAGACAAGAGRGGGGGDFRLGHRPAGRGRGAGGGYSGFRGGDEGGDLAVIASEAKQSSAASEAHG